jgi:hypothetical protein
MKNKNSQDILFYLEQILIRRKTGGSHKYHAEHTVIWAKISTKTYIYNSITLT